jgi:hypothetical protein
MKFSLFENLQHTVTRICAIFKLAVPEASATGRPKKIADVDALTFALYQHRSTRSTKKSVYEDFKSVLQCSYKTFVVSVNRVALLSMHILVLLMRLNKQTAHVVKYTDATDLPVCLKKNADSHQTMQGLAAIGHSSKGWYYGIKLTLTRDHDGKMLALRFTKPGANDRDIFRKINADIHGIIVADAGYVSKQLEQDMYIEGKRWILIRPYTTMKQLMTEWQYILYKGRFQIEFDFRNLKMFHGLITSLPRSGHGYLANYLHALTSFVLA